jgi:hypothetical protein
MSWVKKRIWGVESCVAVRVEGGGSAVFIVFVSGCKFVEVKVSRSSVLTAQIRPSPSLHLTGKAKQPEISLSPIP